MNPAIPTFISEDPLDKGEILGSRVLIIDDSILDRHILSEILSAGGFTNLHCSGNAAESLAGIDEIKPDIIVTDLMMPEMDGFEFCRNIRKKHENFNLPVIVQTAVSEPEHRSKVFKAGATDLMVKPVNAVELTARVSLHLERKHMFNKLWAYHNRIHQELEQARDMQANLLPSAEQLMEYEAVYNIKTATYFMPSLAIGGDFWGMEAIDEQRVGIYICDFSGHGISSALNTFQLHALIQESLGIYKNNPGEFLTSLNRRLHRLIRRGQFATLLYGVIDIRNNSFEYAAAGAPYPLLWQRKNGRTITIDSKGFPIGALAECNYEIRHIEFNPGDALLLYSDALTETPGAYGEFITEDNLCDIMSKAATSGDAEVMLSKIMKGFRDYTTPSVVEDDLTVNVIARS